jgi:hypothetical protein
LLFQRKFIIFGEKKINVEVFIKYKRIKESVDVTKWDEFFNGLIKGGWEIIYYSEGTASAKTTGEPAPNDTLVTVPVVVVVGKRQSNVL